MAITEHGTLVANQVEAVTVTVVEGTVEVVNRSGDAEIWFTVAAEGATPPDPVANGAGCYCVPASVCSYQAAAPGGGAVPVKLISTGAENFSVIGA